MRFLATLLSHFLPAPYTSAWPTIASVFVARTQGRRLSKLSPSVISLRWCWKTSGAWRATPSDDATLRHRYIKLFGGSKYDLLVIVRVEPDGSIFWNRMQRERKK